MMSSDVGGFQYEKLHALPRLNNPWPYSYAAGWAHGKLISIASYMSCQILA